MAWHLNPSSAHRWRHCPGSVGLIAKNRIPSEESKAATEGTLAHVVAFEMTKGRDHPDATDEMVEGAFMYLDDISSTTALAAVRFEHYVAAPNIHPECGGTPDAYFYDAPMRTLYIWDYKFGFKTVEAYENWQLIAYAAGIVTADMNVIKIVFTIVQPRSYHAEGPIRRWEISMVELAGYIEQLRIAAHKTQTDNAPTCTGNHCYKCPAGHVCESLRQTSLGTMDLATEGLPLYMPDEVIGHELSMLQAAADLLEARISGLSEDVTYRIKNGRGIAGYILAPSAGRDVWNVPIEQIITLGKMLEIKLDAPKVITPKQAIKAGIPETVVKAYSICKAGTIALRATGNKMARIFKR